MNVKNIFQTINIQDGSSVKKLKIAAQKLSTKILEEEINAWTLSLVKAVEKDSGVKFINDKKI